MKKYSSYVVALLSSALLANSSFASFDSTEFNALPPAKQAEWFLKLPSLNQSKIFKETQPEQQAQVLLAMGQEQRVGVFQRTWMSNKKQAEIVKAVSPEDGARLLNGVPPADVARTLGKMPEEARVAVSMAMSEGDRVAALESMSPGMAAGIFKAMPQDGQNKMLEALSPGTLVLLLENLKGGERVQADGGIPEGKKAQMENERVRMNRGKKQWRARKREAEEQRQTREREAEEQMQARAGEAALANHFWSLPELEAHKQMQARDREAHKQRQAREHEAALADHCLSLPVSERSDYVRGLPRDHQVMLVRAIGVEQSWLFFKESPLDHFVSLLKESNFPIDVAVGLTTNALGGDQPESRKAQVCRLLCQNSVGAIDSQDPDHPAEKVSDWLVALYKGVSGAPLSSMVKYMPIQVLASLFSESNQQRREEMVASLSPGRALQLIECLNKNRQQQQIEQMWGMLPQEKRNQAMECADQDQRALLESCSIK
jgi:Mg/Co/Ni transporter MgtE